MRRKSKICVYSILESLLKRKWFLCILRQLGEGQSGVEQLNRVAPEMPVQVMNGRLRTLLRYGVVARTCDRMSDFRIEYRLTDFGRKVAHILGAVDELNRECMGQEEDSGSSPKEQLLQDERLVSAAARRAEFMLGNEPARSGLREGAHRVDVTRA